MQRVPRGVAKCRLTIAQQARLFRGHFILAFEAVGVLIQLIRRGIRTPMRGGGLSSRNLLEPLIVVVLHLIEVTRNVPFLQLDPLHQARPPLERLLHLVVPNLLGQGEEQLVRHSA